MTPRQTLWVRSWTETACVSMDSLTMIKWLADETNFQFPFSFSRLLSPLSSRISITHL